MYTSVYGRTESEYCSVYIVVYWYVLGDPWRMQPWSPTGWGTGSPAQAVEMTGGTDQRVGQRVGQRINQMVGSLLAAGSALSVGLLSWLFWALGHHGHDEPNLGPGDMDLPCRVLPLVVPWLSLGGV